MKILAIVLLSAGILSLIYKGFTYTSDTHETKLGPIRVQYHEKERVDVPMWAGVILTVAGAAMLVFVPRKA